MEVGFRDVLEAQTRIAPWVNRTPVHTSRNLDDRLEANLFLKCENFQRTGSFKFRGATNSIRRLDPAHARKGVLTFSSGNHAQALALAGRLADVPVTVVMPQDAPEVKRRATQEYGAEIVLYDRAEQSREAIGRRLAEERGLTLIPPFDHPWIVAGAGTAAKELFEEVGMLDLLLVPCGGGGLLSGSALSARALSPGAQVFGVEPETANDAAMTFRTGKLHRIENPQTIADGARTPSLGELNWSIIRTNVDGFLEVSDEEILEAAVFLAERLKLVVEPTGALGFAAVLSQRIDCSGLRVGVILSGGNFDVGSLARVFTRRGAS